MGNIKNYHKYFTLGRGFDLTLFSNKYAIGLSILTFIVFLIYTLVFVSQDIFDIQNVTLPLEAALLSFLTWAIAREFDPEDPLTAMAAQLVVSVAIFWFFPDFNPFLWALILILTSARLINRISGVETTLWDGLLISLLGVGASLITMNWVYALIATFALVADTLYKKENLTNYIFAFITVSLSTFLIYTEGVYRYVVYAPPLLEYVLIFMLLVTILVRFLYRNKFEMKNDKGEVVDSKRILTGSAFIVISLLFVTIFGGENYYVTGAPIWAISLVYPFIGIFNRE